MKITTIAFAVAMSAALCSAQSIKPGAKYTNRQLAAMTPPVVNLPGVPLVGGSDNCATPDVITGVGNFAFDNTTATDSAPAIPSSCATPVEDVWFVWTAPISGTATMSLCTHTTADTAIAIYDGSACPTLASIGCNDDSCGAASLASFLCVAGNQYMLRVGMFSGNPGVAASFDLSIAPTPPPANDNCATPTAITGVGNFAANMGSATTSFVLPSCQFVDVDHDVWYNWTAPASGNATITLCAHTGADTVLAVYPGGGSCPASGTDIACNDDFCGFASSSQLTLPVTTGTHYTIQVGMFNGGTGVNTSFDITIPGPSNDNCATPINLAGPGTYPFDTTLATTGSQGQTETACNFSSTTAVRKDLWYTYVASMNGTATVATCGMITGGNSSDTKIAAYLGGGCPSSASIACSDDSPCATGSTLATILTFPVTCGTQYTIQLGQFSATANIIGTFLLSETGTGCLTPPTEFCFGTAATCPCGNVGAANNGCASSSVAAGAHLAATGVNSISGDTLLLSGSGMSATGTALYFQGTLQTQVAFGDGLRCAGGNQIRLGTKTNVAGASAYPGAGDMSVSMRGGAIAGSNLTYQVVYRDAANFCTSATFNTTNAVNVVWAP